MATTTKNLGIVSPVPADEWNASTAYQKLNIVSHNNGSYIAKQGSTGIEPGVTTNWETYWMLLVSATGGGSDVEVVQTTGQSTTAVMSQNAVTEELNGKVDKITGKGLSTNDFTDDEKTKLAGIETGAEVNEIDTITAGENVTVSKDGKTVTISATGGGGSGVDIEQTTGQSTTAVMSQKAVTDELEGKLGASKADVSAVGGLVTPTQAPSVVEIVGIDSTGAQVRIQIDTNDFEIDGTISPYTLKKKELISDELAGTWVFNNVPILQDASWQLSFNSNGEDFTKVVIEKNALETLEGGIVYKSYNNGTLDKSVIAYGGDGPDAPTEWNNEAYKTINITSKLSEVTNGETLLAWLQSNATKQ